MESSSSFVQHHEFLDVLLQPLQSNSRSDPIRKQSAMSKRGQEANSSEGSPLSKPKPMRSAMAESRPMNPVEKEQGGAPSIRKLMGNQAKIQSNVLK